MANDYTFKGNLVEDGKEEEVTPPPNPVVSESFAKEGRKEQG